MSNTNSSIQQNPADLLFKKDSLAAFSKEFG